MTRRSYTAALIDPRDRVLQQPRQFRQNWLIRGARVVFAVTIGVIAVMTIAFALFWPAIEGLLDIATR